MPISESGDVVASSRHAEILSALTLQRNALFHTLARIGPEDLASVVDQSASGDTPMDGQALLSRIVMEFGLHRFDLEWALGEPNAGLSTETVLAIDASFGAQLAAIGDKGTAQPEAPAGFHVAGSLIDRSVSWDGDRWADGIQPSMPVVRITGGDSALALFLCGRTGIDDHRLEVDGDRDFAARFKTFVPGP